MRITRYGKHKRIRWGRAWIDNVETWITDKRLIRRGKNKGKYEVTLPDHDKANPCKGRWRDGKRKIIHGSKITRQPTERNEK